MRICMCTCVFLHLCVCPLVAAPLLGASFFGTTSATSAAPNALAAAMSAAAALGGLPRFLGAGLSMSAFRCLWFIVDGLECRV